MIPFLEDERKIREKYEKEELI
jgi:hypothetical protein